MGSFEIIISDNLLKILGYNCTCKGTMKLQSNFFISKAGRVEVYIAMRGKPRKVGETFEHGFTGFYYH
ncbi:MAG: hypothetical protein QW717_03970 [Candidatus Bathyarchaeia archaeon]